MKQRVSSVLVLLGAVIAACTPAPRQEASASAPCSAEAPTASADTASFTSRFIAIGQDSLHYLDFGGEGLHVVLTAGSRPASVWTGFAPRLTGCARVLAVTDRALASGGFAATESRAADILALLDSLDIARAVVIANANPVTVLLHLGENHPDRLEGLVFLSPPREVGVDPILYAGEPARMAFRALTSRQGGDPDAVDEVMEEARRAGDAWDGWPKIEVPTLTFVNLEGGWGLQGSPIVSLARMLVDTTDVNPEADVPDSISRAYMTRLATDPVLQAELESAWDSVWTPRALEHQQAFYDAFGDHIRTVRINAPMMEGASVVSGYEFRDAPELIEEHVRAFLEDVRSGAVEGWSDASREGEPESSRLANPPPPERPGGPLGL